MKHAPIAVLVALFGVIVGAVFVDLSGAARDASSVHSDEDDAAQLAAQRAVANPPVPCGGTGVPACPGSAPYHATTATAATKEIMTVSSRSYACDSVFGASMFVPLAKGEQYDGNSDVNQMLDDDVKNGDCKDLYGGVAMVIVNDPDFSSKDLSAVKIKGSDREWFTPTFLMTSAAADFVPPPDWLYADVKHDDNASARPADAFDPISGHTSNDPATKAEPVEPSNIYGSAPTPAN